MTTKVELYQHQRQAKRALYAHWRNNMANPAENNPVIGVPTGGGKTHIYCSVIEDVLASGREKNQPRKIVMLTHVQELVEQGADTLAEHYPDVPFGIYCGGLKRHDTEPPVILGTVNSLYKQAERLGPLDLVVIDEAHRVRIGGDDANSGMYRRFLADAKAMNPNLRVLGLTATPFRTSEGDICNPDGPFHTLVYQVSVLELIQAEKLCRITSRRGSELAIADTSKLHHRRGEFIESEMEQAFDQDELVRAACKDIVEQTRERRKTLIFACSVKHGAHIVRELQERHNIVSGFVTGETPKKQRKDIIEQFRSGSIRYLTNCQVLTTGFDVRDVDTVVLLRPTMSPVLYAQMIGRGMRIHPEKDKALLLDYGGNVQRHGLIDKVRAGGSSSGEKGSAPVKLCPNCDALIPTSCLDCPECGHEFPRRKFKHQVTAYTGAVTSDQLEPETRDVRQVQYEVHQTKNPTPGNPTVTMRVSYVVGGMLVPRVHEYVCIEHGGRAGREARKWWKARSNDDFPASVDEAVALANAGSICRTLSIEYVLVGKFPEILEYELGEKPEAVLVG